jgi:hypothetical protein
MPAANRKLTTYREVAECYDRCGHDTMRDRFLVLAADAALSMSQIDEAERLRIHLLERNPHHLLQPYASFEEAMKSVDVQNYVAALRRSHPFEKAEYLLETMRSPSIGQAEQPAEAKNRPIPRAEQEARDQAHIYLLQPSLPEPKPIRSPFNDPSVPPKSKSASQSKGQAMPIRADRDPDVYPIQPDLGVKARSRGSAETSTEWKESPDALVSIFLAVLVFLGGLALALYALAWPFLPQAWLP